MHRTSLLAAASFFTLFYLILLSRSAKMDKAVPLFSPVGISLTATYGTISIRYHDGSFEDIGRVDGNDRYIRMMHRLSSPSAKHLSPPYGTMEDLWNDWPRQMWRLLRKRLGLPASSDVGILSDMLKRLLETASPYYSRSPQSAVISYPSIVALYNEDIVDAADYLRVLALQGQHSHQPREIVAAYAGHGMGLCQSYEDWDKCSDEGRELPAHHTLLIEYTERALLLHGAVMKEAVDNAPSDIDAKASFDLGSDNARAHGHVERVKDFVLEFLRLRYRLSGPPDEIMVIMTGSAESVGDDAVQKVIAAAVEELGSTANMLTSMPDKVAARGAAEFAWRSLTLFCRRHHCIIEEPSPPVTIVSS